MTTQETKITMDKVNTILNGIGDTSDLNKQDNDTVTITIYPVVYSPKTAQEIIVEFDNIQVRRIKYAGNPSHDEVSINHGDHYEFIGGKRAEQAKIKAAAHCFYTKQHQGWFEFMDVDKVTVFKINGRQLSIS